MAAPRAYDFIPIKNRFIQGTESISALAREFGIKNVSTLSRRAHKEGWPRLRAEFQRQTENKSLELVAEKRAQKIADIHMDTLEVIHAGILKAASDMDAKEPVMDGGQVLRDAKGAIVYRPLVRYTPRDFAILIEKFLVLIGQPTDVTEERHLGLNLTAATEPGALREILAALRPRAALAGASGGPEGLDPARTRTN